MNPPSIELRAWRQFLAVADELHFGRAALRLHMTQPPLTQAIAQLERRLGVRLFDRTQRRVALTATGAALVGDARSLLERAEALPARATAAADGMTGRLRLAFVSTVGFGVLPAWVRAFREGRPGVELDLVEATGDLQLVLFERGEIDAGFVLHVPGAAPPGFDRRMIGREALVLAMPETHPLARGPLRAERLLDQPLVLFPRRILPSLHDALTALYRRGGRSLPVAQEAIQMQTIVNLVSAGLGIAWVPASVMRFQRPGVVYRRLAKVGGQAVPVCETSLVWPVKGRTPALERFLAFDPPATRDVP